MKTSAFSRNLLIVAAGKGRSMCLPPIVDTVVDLVSQRISHQTKTVNMCFLGTASYDKPEVFHLQTEAYQDIPNFSIKKLDLSEAAHKIPSQDEIQETILTANVIQVSGGNTLYAMNRWRDLGVDDLIRQVALQENGPVLCGGSAGANVWFEYSHSDSMDPMTFLNVDPNLTEEQKRDWDYIRVSGLGFIPALCVPHHDATQSNGLPRSQASDAMLLKYPEHPSVGIDEAAALVISNGEARCVSGDGRASCYIKRVETDERGGPRIESHVFTGVHGSVSIDKLLEGRF